MPSPISVLTLITSSMRLIGAVASGEDITPEEANDALLTLNDLLENWSVEKLSVWGALNQTFNLVAGQSTYTIGVGGNFNTGRPVAVDAGYTVFGGVSYDLTPMNQYEYNSISIKTMQNQIPERMLYVNNFPLGQLTFWPVPTTNSPVTLTIGRVLTSPVTITDSLTGPPGFLKALRYCLAVELAPEFGVEASETVFGVAADAKGDYKKSNQVDVVARFDDALVYTNDGYNYEGF